jgi:error-prone DNA polymerase
MGFWSPQSLVADARRHGVVVERPDVDRSGPDATLEHRDDGLVVRLGLTTVRGVGTPAAERIAAGAPWRDQEDLVRRAGVTRPQLEALAAAGALDAMGTSRRALAWTAGAAAQSSPDRLEGIVTGTVAPALGAPTPLESVADDLWALGLAPEATALSLARESLEAQGVLPASALLAAETERVVVAGVVTHRQHPETAHGAVFVNLEDETGHVNVIFSKGAWARWRHIAGSAPALVIRGRLERAQGTVGVSALHVRALELGAPAAPSRDFR